MDRSDVDGLDWDERGLRMVRDVDAGQWIVDRVHGFDHTVASLLPPDFPAYARVFHPAATADGRPVRWAEVAAANGTTAHPVMEWGSIVGAWGTPGQPGVWDDDPAQGSLPPRTARTLAAVLADTGLEAFLARADQTLTWDGDTVNPLPAERYS